ncbi:restriction endonuclease subunit S [Lactococcus lactis]|uniref:restriction endonuclease subunit S n=1 Tax=Lactococcus lactis TaxID=1358 RepID=UPI0015C36272|nr:restriction endonuclease subunit S [Lactococcus lactis]MCT0076401.1 hypothetical protein [Lactococcus lactis subsp. lactis]MDH5113798.1 restriction endonuclease subunit S [Lactococcus lactis]QLF89491.1 restriction endonuclease subunit S [Lactococcus lactis subsp. lactis]
MSKNKKLVPKRRFKEFQNSDAWEQRELGEVGQTNTGNTPPTSNSQNYEDDGLLWVTPTDIDGNIIRTTAKKLSKLGIKKARVVPKGSILATCIASIGKNALILEDSAFNQQINSLSPNENNDSYFLLTQSELWSKKMQSIAASGTMQIINKTEFSKLSFYFPVLTEQKHIGEFFSSLDQTITFQQQKLEKLQNIKKAYLNEMFI